MGALVSVLFEAGKHVGAEAPPVQMTAREPSVGVVLATHNRPELMRRALESILAQEYSGPVTVVVVHDKCAVDQGLVRKEGGRQVLVLANSRTPGLAGARNTGILSLDTELVAFCDDDDVWLPGKLRLQVAALLAVPGAEFASTAMEVDYQGTTTVRLAGAHSVSHEDFLRSRMAMVHSSSFLARLDILMAGIGLVDESIPNSMCEDWDLLLRASRRRPVVHLDQPLIRVLWGGSSYFYQQWAVKNVAHLWMLEHHRDIETSKVGAGRVYGQLAFGHAALGQRRQAFGWAAKSLRTNWREPRALLALAVACRLVSDRQVVDRLQRKGRGI
jgi:glycosyltransferase involved in cell wall biosynthesis